MYDTTTATRASVRKARFAQFNPPPLNSYLLTSWKTDGGPIPGITFSSNARRTSSHNALMHPFSTFALLVHFRQFAVTRP